MKRLGSIVLLSVFFLAMGIAAFAQDDSESAYDVGDQVQVLWNGKWYDAKVIDVGADNWKITYAGYDSSWDEWVSSDRIRDASNPFPVNKKVDVLWNGTWYTAKVIESGKGKWKITYEGYDSNWDEWVGKDRIRAFTKK